MERKETASKIEQLKKVYALHDKAVGDIQAECRQGCSSCCTCNVILTSLETDFLIARLTDTERRALADRVARFFPEQRYLPKMTTNRFARLCVQGKKIPEEDNDPSWGACPILEDSMCSLYETRPFGCRALMSQVSCEKKGYAKIPPFVLSVNNVFVQYIEHMDQNGFSGNLSDMLTLFLSDRLAGHRLGSSAVANDEHFVFNEKIAVLMVPPEHRQRIRPLLDQLSGLT